jgi:hypothetical protein
MRRDVSMREARSSGNQTETAKPSPKQDEGAVCVRWVRCGRSWCRCMRGGPKHGPYFARYWWRDGRRHKRYVRQIDAVEAVAACSARHASERFDRASVEDARQAWRAIRVLVREIEHGQR